MNPLFGEMADGFDMKEAMKLLSRPPVRDCFVSYNCYGRGQKLKDIIFPPLPSKEIMDKIRKCHGHEEILPTPPPPPTMSHAMDSNRGMGRASILQIARMNTAGTSELTHRQHQPGGLQQTYAASVPNDDDIKPLPEFDNDETLELNDKATSDTEHAETAEPHEFIKPQAVVRRREVTKEEDEVVHARSSNRPRMANRSLVATQQEESSDLSASTDDDTLSSPSRSKSSPSRPPARRRRPFNPRFNNWKKTEVKLPMTEQTSPGRYANFLWNLSNTEESPAASTEITDCWTLTGATTIEIGLFSESFDPMVVRTIVEHFGLVVEMEDRLTISKHKIMRISMDTESAADQCVSVLNDQKIDNESDQPVFCHLV